MTRKKKNNKNIENQNMNSNSYQNPTGWYTNNCYNDGQQKKPGNDFRNNYPDPKYWDNHTNKVSLQNSNCYKDSGRVYMSHSDNNNRNHNEREGQINNMKGFERGHLMEDSNPCSKNGWQKYSVEPLPNKPGSDYLISHNHIGRGRNSSHVTNSKIDQSKNKDFIKKHEQNVENVKSFTSQFVNHGPNYYESSQQIDNLGGDFEQSSKKFVKFMSEESFLKSLNSGENSSASMASKIKSQDDLPVPAPRTSVVSKFEDENSKGARKKQRGNNSNHRINGYCMTCEKTFATDGELHRDHKFLPFDMAIQELKEQDQNKIVNAIEEANSQLKEEMQTKDIIDLHKSSINPCLSNVFKELKESSQQNIDQLNRIRDSGMQTMNNCSIDNITDFMSFLNFRSTSQNIITKNQKLLSDLKRNSCWLIFSWFKISIGLIMQSGGKIYSEIKSKSSAPSYANFDLYGDRLRLFSFKNNIKPERDAMILPFESIRALLKNEDSKAFMIVRNNHQEGQVVFRINEGVFWGQQFISLCLGDRGPSFRSTRFFRSCGKGKPYHHIWGGDYSQDNGSGGEAFLPWDEPLKQSSEEIVRGLLAARYGHNDKSTIFRIYIKGAEQSPPTKDNFCFGYVEEGMENLEFFANQPEVTKATIKDSGCFLVLK